jgi:hypothetical protein
MTVEREPVPRTSRKMEGCSIQYCLRVPPDLYKDAADLALVFDLSLNRFLAAAIEKFVASQLQQEPTLRAIERIREARGVGLVASSEAGVRIDNTEVRRRPEQGHT